MGLQIARTEGESSWEGPALGRAAVWVGLGTRNGVLAREACRTELHLKAGSGERENKEGAWSQKPCVARPQLRPGT